VDGGTGAGIGLPQNADAGLPCLLEVDGGAALDGGAPGRAEQRGKGGMPRGKEQRGNGWPRGRHSGAGGFMLGRE
jgi:hypothetical protein